MGKAKETAPLLSLQQKFLKSGLKGMSEAETLELLLSLYTPDKNFRKLAGRMLTRFNNLKGLLDASSEQVRQIPGVSSRDVLVLSAIQNLSQKYLAERILDGPLYEKGRVVFDYLYHEMRGLDSEQFKMICLDKSKKIVKTLDILTIKPDTSIAVSTRAAIEQVILLGCQYFIVAHNHLSGDSKPTQKDKTITRDLVFAGMIIQIRLLDHVIIGKDSFYSFSNEGLIEEFEAEFQALKLRGTAEAKRRLMVARKPADQP
jgi:DNA repair protein RadC